MQVCISFCHLLQDALAQLRSGEAELPDVFDQALFLPNCIQTPGLLHILYNSLEDAFTELADWTKFERQLKAVAKVLGTKRLAQKFQGVSMAESGLLERLTMDSFRGQHADWRWECLEGVCGGLTEVFGLFVEYWRASDFTNSKEDANTVLLANEAVKEAKEFFLP